MLRLFLRMGGWLLLLPLFVAAVALADAAARGPDAAAVSTALATHGVEVDATVTKRTHERGRRRADQHRVAFTFRTGSVLGGDLAVHRGEVTVSAAYHDRVQDGGTIRLRYLPEDPSVVELEPGAIAAVASAGYGVALVMLGVTLPLAVLLLLQAWRATRVLRSGRRTGAQVVAVHDRRLFSTFEFRFVDEAGAQRGGRSLPRRRAGVQGLAPGRTVEVVYDPRDPRRAWWAGEL